MIVRMARKGAETAAPHIVQTAHDGRDAEERRREEHQEDRGTERCNGQPPECRRCIAEERCGDEVVQRQDKAVIEGEQKPLTAADRAKRECKVAAGEPTLH